MSGVRLFIEYQLARAARVVVPRLSRPAVLRLGRVLAWAAYYLSARERKVGAANLHLAFPERSPRDRQGILRAAFQNFAQAMLDTFWFSRHTAERIAAYTRFDEVAFAPLFKQAPQILITAHYGNWEVMGMAFALRGHPLTSVAAPIKNPAVDHLFNELRNSTGQRILSKHGVLRPLLRTLNQGKKIALVLDQNTKPAEGGRFVRFFGLGAPVSTAAAALWERTRAEVLVAMCLPQPGGRYEFTSVTPVAPPEASTSNDLVLDMTQRITAALEATIRAAPEHWLWMYKRWKYVEPGADPETYPFYAHPLPTPADKPADY